MGALRPIGGKRWPTLADATVTWTAEEGFPVTGVPLGWAPRCRAPPRRQEQATPFGGSAKQFTRLAEEW